MCEDPLVEAFKIGYNKKHLEIESEKLHDQQIEFYFKFAGEFKYEELGISENLVIQADLMQIEINDIRESNLEYLTNILEEMKMKLIEITLKFNNMLFKKFMRKNVL